jgi:hypothetical protein
LSRSLFCKIVFKASLVVRSSRFPQTRRYSDLIRVQCLSLLREARSRATHAAAFPNVCTDLESILLLEVKIGISTRLKAACQDGTSTRPRVAPTLASLIMAERHEHLSSGLQMGGGRATLTPPHLLGSSLQTGIPTTTLVNVYSACASAAAL